MKDIEKLIIGSLLIFLLITNLPRVEGWSEALPLSGATYDIRAGQSVAISPIAAPTGATAVAATVDYKPTVGAVRQGVDFLALTGLTLSSTGISGTTGAAVTIDGVFKVTFTVAAGAVDKWIKIKIDPAHVSADNIGVPGAAGAAGAPAAWAGPQIDPSVSLAPGVNACGQILDAGSCGAPPEPGESVCARISAKKEEIKVALAIAQGEANANLAQIQADAPEKTSEIVAAAATGATEIIGGIAQFTPFGFLSTAIHEAGATVRDGNIFSGTVTAEAHLNNIFQSNISESDTTKSQTSCESSSGSTYLNSFVADAVCTADTMGLSQGNFMTLALAGKVGPFVDGVNQSIVNDIEASCIQEATMEAVTRNMDLVETTATNSAVAELEGTGTIDSSGDQCNEQITNKNTCTYLSSQQCCSDVRNDIMNNMVRVSSCFADVDDLTQTINIKSKASCDTDVDETIDLTSISSVASDAAADGGVSVSPNSLYMVIAICCLVIGGIGLYFVVS